MGKSIKLCTKNTNHRSCRWHLLKSAKENLGAYYSKYKGFKAEFNSLITDELNIQKFEEGWDRIVRKYRLTKNKYLKRLFNHRQIWEKSYFMGIFCAEMTSTHRSESANHMLKRYIQQAAPVHLIVSKFNEFLSVREKQEGKEQHATKMVSRRLRVGAPIEEHANAIYTRAMFEKFYDELYEAGKFAIHERSDEGEFKVLLILDYSEIPSGNILQRWTKSAMKGKEKQETSQMRTDDQANDVRKQALLLKTLEIINGKNKITETGFIQAMSALSNSGKSELPKR
ncbi:unnamed protein product [Urochloa decumbens]|uniref:Protein FAR1-RELATED SEQUENCE n=1 Tax=Urochloa decumbens TaxID=240449 RepID=A0ABC8VYG0_9POAL